IADLMPKTPIYTAMLPESARSVMGVPHPSGRAAMKMLGREGFTYDCYIDIFDGGPTMSVATDQILSIRESRLLTLSSLSQSDGVQHIIAAGRLADFHCCYASVGLADDGTATLDSESARLLGIEPGQSFLAMGR
ncbi:MAG TPA: arginine N-succinyltransferase, partial [Allosphingosinicella sp.]|nr:arginine N-succinyltransferase [Allosphingosinicella sp.]